MNWYRELNGDIVKALAVLGAVLIGLLMVLAVNSIAEKIFGYNLSDVWEAVIGGFVLLTSGGVGLKYAQGHDLHKKEQDE